MRQFCLLVFLLVFHFFIKAVEGTVILTNGEVLSGKISFNRSLSFWDVFRERYVTISSSDIYKISIFEKSVEFFPSDPALVEKNYIMGVTTWEGKSYWGGFNCQVTVRTGVKAKEKTRKFVITDSRQTKLSTPHIREIICAPSQRKIPTLLSLSGQICPSHTFHTVYALHHQYGVIFPANISPEQDWYEIPELMPGNYDLIFIGQGFVVFCLTPPLRKGIMDNEVLPSSPEFKSWMEREVLTGPNSRKELIYLVGRHSDTRAIVMEEMVTLEEVGSNSTVREGKRFFWLCLCHCRNTLWKIKRLKLLYHQDINEPVPQFFLDYKLANIVVPLDGGSRRFDCLWE